MRTFKHLFLEERERYFVWKAQGISLREIGRRLGRSHSTFSREPKRNAKYGRPYLPCTAHRKSEKRGLKQRYRAPLKEPLIFLYVREKLRDEKWSPETIAGRLPLDHPGYSILKLHSTPFHSRSGIALHLGNLIFLLPYFFKNLLFFVYTTIL